MFLVFLCVFIHAHWTGCKIYPATIGIEPTAFGIPQPNVLLALGGYSKGRAIGSTPVVDIFQPTRYEYTLGVTPERIYSPE